MRIKSGSSVRTLVIVLGDQLDAASSAFDGFETEQDAVWMCESRGEAEHVWSHKARIAIFLSAMRHFCDDQRRRGRQVFYRAIDEPGNRGPLAENLLADVATLEPERMVVVEPGEWRLEQSLREVSEQSGVPIDFRADRHFLCSRETFTEHASGRKQLRMEYFYREMRRRHGVLMDGDQPAGGSWNYDADNRKAFGKTGPEEVPLPPAFEPDETTRGVLRDVEKHFARHPGSLQHFNWPVTPGQAATVLDDFIKHRLNGFGTYQDAMWAGEPFLRHSLLSSSLNLKLLDPGEVIRAAEKALRQKRAPLHDVEGFIRQVLGWREYVRGVYGMHMPGYLERNALNADADLPAFYWTAETDMACLREVIGQTLEYGYAHHIQRLMVTGLYALLLGVHPRQVHEWYLAIYVDAIEWVELPNTLGMSQFADGGVMASKPYCASGKYIRRMSNYCEGCPYDPGEATGEKACPFTTLYWDFLMRHRDGLASNRRMRMQLKNLDRLTAARRKSIRKQAERTRQA